MSNLVRLLSIIAVIIPFESEGLFWNLPNYFELSAGLIRFLHDGQRDYEEKIQDTTPHFGAAYDFVIVGAGTAGAAIAARLTEIPDVKVLLIEAGSRENLVMDIPLLAYMLQMSDLVNWKYQTKPSNKYCLGSTEGKCNFPRGKGMGGSSSINYMLATRGTSADYDRWAEMGNNGWAYKDVLKYFKKLENMRIPELRSDTVAHGTGGPVDVTYPSFRTKLADAFVQAGIELGYPEVDYNAKETIGFAHFQATIKNGSRMSSNKAYLYPARDRRNLHVTQESLVRRVLIDHRKNRAVGVEFTKQGRTISVFAKKEVILCAGPIATPQLLMLSGIGPAEHLAKFGISVVRDIPGVGENLMDHVGLGNFVFSVNGPFSIQLENIINPNNPYLVDYMNRRTGPLVVGGGCEAIAFVNTEHPEKRSGLPNIELLFLGSAIKGDPIHTVTFNMNTEMTRFWNKHKNYYGWSVVPLLLKPKSRGRIRLLANDINVKPEIIPNYFEHAEDIDTLISGIRFLFNVSQTKAMKAYGSYFLNDTAPGCEHYEYDTRDYWECSLRVMTTTIYHYCCTSKMGPESDPTAVVDPTLKVIGVRGLRVADSSIMPDIVSAHLNLPTFMIAEKAADMIKTEWGYLKK
ncbi:glucose dehydrogenase [FAD, quinone]-like [Linepithema humile]|uniref:glucose dehydrogenase [FAD, quinone]-like n=1 Tax=Linepithema humile TaxID=83485 RepID=UPI0006230061|nr:PREDICTED: glucose dehydrogenase [FAD, quinone]-like [Linepithema humile]XP_012215915.1 PREDICTED: glucose dehydrogenase [FAD, quinone]-like [Linepithema humile]